MHSCMNTVTTHHFKVEHEVEFADVAKEAVERLHQAVDKLKDGQLILCACQYTHAGFSCCKTRTSSPSTPTRKNNEAYRR